jgi:hypothetical protein
VDALASGYRTAGFAAQVLGAYGRKGHLLVTFPLGGTYRVDVLKEPLNHPAVWMEFGPVIALADARPELIAEVRAGALNWSTDIGLDMAESEAWSDDDQDTDLDD